MLQPNLKWTRELQGLGRVPVVAGNSVITVVFDQHNKAYKVCSFLKDNGELEWECRLFQGGYSTPFVTDSLVYCPTGFTKYAAVNRITGEVEWIEDFGSRVRSSPVIVGDQFYILIANCFIEMNLATRQKNSFEKEDVFFFGKPLIVGNRAYLLGTSNRDRQVPRLEVHAIDLVTRTFQWSKQLGEGYVVSSDCSGLTYGDGTVFAGGANGVLYALDAETGNVSWQYQTEDALLRHAPLFFNGRVYVGGIGGTFTAVQASDGTCIFEKRIDDQGIWSTASATSEGIVVHGGIWLYLLDDTTGEEKWKFPVGVGPYTQPMTDGKHVYICGGDPPDRSYLYALDTVSPSKVRLINQTIQYNPDMPQHLALSFEVEVRNQIPVKEVFIDLTSLGGENWTKLTPDSLGYYHLSTSVKKSAVQGEYALAVTVKTEEEWLTTTLPVNLRFDQGLPSKCMIKGFPLFEQQRVTDSGPSSVSAILHYFGKEDVSAEDIRQMSHYVKEQIPDAHHLWRAGTVRMLHASGRVLVESVGGAIKPSDLFEV